MSSFLDSQDISCHNDAFVAQALKSRMITTDLVNTAEYLSYAQNSPEEQAAFFSLLHVKYSSFFRNSLTFAHLEHHIIPTIIQKAIEHKKREVRIWSAGCADGQEPISIAMLIEEYLENSQKKIDYSIFATEKYVRHDNPLSTHAFSLIALNNLTQSRISRWFTQRDLSYTISHELTRHIEYSAFDMIGLTNRPPTSIFGEFDLVLCCNLLIYYQAECQEIILKKLVHSLKPQGYLITGETERNTVLQFGCTEVYAQSGIFKHTVHKRFETPKFL